MRQVTASVVRNLSWRADPASKQALREAGAVTALTRAALRTGREPALKSILSALWNLSAHCGLNKVSKVETVRVRVCVCVCGATNFNNFRRSKQNNRKSVYLKMLLEKIYGTIFADEYRNKNIYVTMSIFLHLLDL